jgi:RNA polymerase sigma factor (sigma-70 family)
VVRESVQVVGVLADDEVIAAIEQAYRDDYRRLLRVAVGMLGDCERGRDAVQEAFERALRSRSDLRSLDRLHGWLWQTLINICRVELRHKVDHLHDGYEPGQNGHAEEWPEMRATIAALPERQRLVLFLRHYADLDYEHIAQVVGIERGTVAATLHTAHEKVREAMKGVQAVRDDDVQDILDRLVDKFDGEIGDWNDVLERAGLASRGEIRVRGRRRRGGLLLLAAAAVVAAVALAVVSPWHGGASVVDRAAAAILAPGSGQVLYERITLVRWGTGFGRGHRLPGPQFSVPVEVWVDGRAHRFRATFAPSRSCWPRRWRSEGASAA